MAMTQTIRTVIAPPTGGPAHAPLSLRLLAAASVADQIGTLGHRLAQNVTRNATVFNIEQARRIVDELRDAIDRLEPLL